MHTPTHLAMAVALLGNKDRPKDTKWIVWGALIPDLPMFALVAFDRLRGLSFHEIFDVRYFQPYWQIPNDLAHSIPLYVALLLVAYIMKWRGIMFLCVAALLHIAFDLPLHREDAHAHFYPFSTWRFVSPVSYWDRAHFGNIVMIFEMIGLVIFAIIGARVFQHLWAKLLFLAVTLFIPLAFLVRFVAF